MPPEWGRLLQRMEPPPAMQQRQPSLQDGGPCQHTHQPQGIPAFEQPGCWGWLEQEQPGLPGQAAAAAAGQGTGSAPPGALSAAFPAAHAPGGGNAVGAANASPGSYMALLMQDNDAAAGGAAGGGAGGQAGGSLDPQERISPTPSLPGTAAAAAAAAGGDGMYNSQERVGALLPVPGTGARVSAPPTPLSSAGTNGKSTPPGRSKAKRWCCWCCFSVTP